MPASSVKRIPKLRWYGNNVLHTQKHKKVQMNVEKNCRENLCKRRPVCAIITK